jgi:hypothetical protein
MMEIQEFQKSNPAIWKERRNGNHKRNETWTFNRKEVKKSLKERKNRIVLWKRNIKIHKERNFGSAVSQNKRKTRNADSRKERKNKNPEKRKNGRMEKRTILTTKTRKSNSELIQTYIHD